MKKIWAGVAAVSLVVAIGGVYSILKKEDGNRVVKVKKGDITEAIYGLGTVVAKQKFSFKVGVPKTITRIFVTEGDTVQKNQNLLSFDDGISVSSPFDGTVTLLPYKAGENAFTDQPVVTVQNLKDLYLEAKLDQQGALRVKKNMTARISFENLRQTVFKGKIDSLYPANGQFVARLIVEGLPAEILPGMTADVAIEVAQKTGVVLLPLRAVHNSQVVRKLGAHTEKVSVQLGIMDNELGEEVSGQIKEGDSLILKD